MIDEQFLGVDLKALAARLAEVEAFHVQQREEGGWTLTGCSCGATYSRADDTFAESRAHLRMVLLTDLLETLSGPCDTCRGSGQWRKFRGTYICPDCGGIGRSLFPLHPMEFRDREGTVWVVTKMVGDTATIELRTRQ